jgi:hypothetical protein
VSSNLSSAETTWPPAFGMEDPARPARLDNSVEAEMRALARVEILILDDLALQAMHATDTSDFYELIVERHQNQHHRHLEPRPQANGSPS